MTRAATQLNSPQPRSWHFTIRNGRMNLNYLLSKLLQKFNVNFMQSVLF